MSFPSSPARPRPRLGFGARGGLRSLPSDPRRAVVAEGRDALTRTGPVSSSSLGLLVLVCLTSSADYAASSQPEKKPAWQWTAEERLAERFHPDSMQARAEANAIREAKVRELFGDTQTYARASDPATDSISGDENPELFLTWELFDHLLELGFPSSGNDLTGRQIIDDRAAPAGFGADLWNRLEKASHQFLLVRDQTNSRRLRAVPQGARSSEDTDLHWCRTRASAITRAKAEFGEEKFLRLLYEVAAPGMSKTYVVTPGTKRHLRFIEGGCL